MLTTSTVGLPAATVNQSLSQSTVNQVCALIFTRNQTIDVGFIDVEPQTNSTDCGVYAIAFATSLCFCFVYLYLRAGWKGNNLRYIL